MYQGLDMVISTASNPEHEGHENPDHLIGEKKEDAREARHDEHHDGGDHGGPRRNLNGLTFAMRPCPSDVCSDRPERRAGPQNLAVIYTLISGKAPRPA